MEKTLKNNKVWRNSGFGTVLGKGLLVPQLRERVKPMIPERFNSHFSYLDELDAAIDDALNKYSDAKEEDVVELRSLKHEIQLARGALYDLCGRFAEAASA